MDGRKKTEVEDKLAWWELILKALEASVLFGGHTLLSHQRLLYIDFVPGALQGFVAVEAVPATGGRQPGTYGDTAGNMYKVPDISGHLENFLSYYVCSLDEF